jgi:hypothetical protein
MDDAELERGLFTPPSRARRDTLPTAAAASRRAASASCGPSGSARAGHAPNGVPFVMAAVAWRRYAERVVSIPICYMNLATCTTAASFFLKPGT